MNAIDAYLASYADSHPRSSLDAQLQASGHSMEAIMAAWHRREAERARAGMPTMPTMPTSAVAVAPARTAARFSPASLAGTLGRQPVAVVFALVAIVVAAAVAFFGVELHSPFSASFAPRSSDTSLAPVNDGDLDTTTLERAKATADEFADSTTTLDGDLPSGWTEQSDGMWTNIDAGASMIVLRSPDAGFEFDEFVSLNIDGVESAGIEVTNGPVDATLAGHEAKRLEVLTPISGIKAKGTQWYVKLDGEVAVVTVTTLPDTSAKDRKEALKLADSLDFGD
ncbi:MAG: hypothetical protein KDC46_05770 [Thermoleophilia bacterium]|nr:hypothetical protein [Thermoleophilia bacterium]